MGPALEGALSCFERSHGFAVDYQRPEPGLGSACGVQRSSKSWLQGLPAPHLRNFGFKFMAPCSLRACSAFLAGLEAPGEKALDGKAWDESELCKALGRRWRSAKS